MSLNAHGNMVVANREALIEACKRYGPHRLRLALVVQQMLREFALNFFLDGGTLMGAYRDGRCIPHDDDFDLALFSEIAPHLCDSFLSVLCKRAKKWLTEHEGTIIPDRIEVRAVTTYAKKLEFYLPEFGNYPFRETNFHNATVDLQLLTPFPDDPDNAQIQHSLYTRFKIPRSSLLPTTLIAYEGHMFVAPKDPKEYLTAVYGYIGPNAIFNSETGKYEQA